MIAASFARIFRQNMFNCGMLALELPEAQVDTLFDTFAAVETCLEMDLAGSAFTLAAQGRKERCTFEISPFDRALVEAGGWVDYADQHY